LTTRKTTYCQVEKNMVNTNNTWLEEINNRNMIIKLACEEDKWWIVKLACVSHNYDLINTIINHPYVGWFIHNEKSIFVDMIKSLIKLKNIWFTLSDHNEKCDNHKASL